MIANLSLQQIAGVQVIPTGLQQEKATIRLKKALEQHSQGRSLAGMQDNVVKVSGAMRDKQAQMLLLRGLGWNFETKDGHPTLRGFQMPSQQKIPVQLRLKGGPGRQRQPRAAGFEVDEQN
jgi:hypothetical protein